MKKPELLSPAGTLKNMRYAFAYGADAVYAGLPRYSLRVRNNDFLEENLAKGEQPEGEEGGEADHVACLERFAPRWEGACGGPAN